MNRLLLPIGCTAVLLLVGCSKPEVGTNLVYEVDRSSLEPSAEVDSQALVSAVERRLTRGWSSAGKVELLPDGRIRVGVFGHDPAELERVKLMLGGTGRLEFRILANIHDHFDLITRGQASKDRQIVDADYREAPRVVARWVKTTEENAQYLPKNILRDDGGGGREVLVVVDSINLTGEYLRSASASADQRGQPCVVFSLNAIGSQKLGELTTANLPDPVSGFKRQLAIILDGVVVTAPSINSAIYDRGEITGNFTAEEVERTAAILMAGPFPAPLKLVSETAMGK
jgi:preprotein translocase subunit SecD